MRTGEAAKELGVCPCVVPRLVRLGWLKASYSDDGDMEIDPTSVREHKVREGGRKYPKGCAPRKPSRAR